MKDILTTILMNPDLKKQLKTVAMQEKRSLSKQISRICEEWLNARKPN